MLNQLLKLGALIATGRFLKPRAKGLLWLLLAWLVLWFLHGEFVGYVELSGDTRYVLHASLIKLALYAASLALYVWRIERPLWPKTTPVPPPRNPVPPTVVGKPAILPPGDDGFDFLRNKKKLRDSSEQLLGKKNS